MKRTLTIDRARELLQYDAQAGVLRHRIARGPRKAGDAAGTRRSDGYWVNQVDGVFYQAGRLVWFLHHARWPDGEIDHIDGDPGNNRIENLRDATPTVNKQNKRRVQSGKRYSQLLGAQWCRQAGKWKSSIRVDGRIKHIGFFPTDMEAHVAYIEAKRRFHEGCTL